MTAFANALYDNAAFLTFVYIMVIVNGNVAAVIVGTKLLPWLWEQPAAARRWWLEFRQGKAYATYALHRAGRHVAVDRDRFRFLPEWGSLGYGGAAS